MSSQKMPPTTAVMYSCFHPVALRENILFHHDNHNHHRLNNNTLNHNSNRRPSSAFADAHSTMDESRASSVLSFHDRDGSASPSLSATPGRSSYSPSDRSFSTASSITDYSETSKSRRSSSFGAQGKRRGYVRTEGASFAESAKNRESVMSLGSIAHLQYYFARTGLLDGKGAQLAKQKKNGDYDIPQLRLSTIGMEGDFTASPTDEAGEPEWDMEPSMLPPTVSTYAHRPIQAPPPPDTKTLKKDLVQALENALHALEAVDRTSNQEPPEEAQGFHELQGLHILDVTTLAIRAARVYYISHSNPTRLSQIKSEKALRAELISVMDILKRYATRKFQGGLREEERLGILVWVSDVSQMINTETKIDEAERRERESWQWMPSSQTSTSTDSNSPSTTTTGDSDDPWINKAKERESSFLSTLLSLIPQSTFQSENLPTTLPAFSDPSCSTTIPLSHDHPLLSVLSDGRLLIHLHNSAVRLSKRQFGSITTHHSDIAKPYRRAENLRFWLKAAEIRWEIKFHHYQYQPQQPILDVMAIVNSSPQPEPWERFEAVILQWCRCVREEITKDLQDPQQRLHARNLSSASIAAALASQNLSSSSSDSYQRDREREKEPGPSITNTNTSTNNNSNSNHERSESAVTITQESFGTAF